ncbi:hypothetical protein [Achromobacter xylosoxidans]|uniref:hypothetical protein n=1 Tax=Alcaligenes xylosoxydans xylosoxydans TaxID=85698 RepID=UPI001EECC745|nr:hypothetical protein [Achromobacter xylosoxidans]
MSSFEDFVRSKAGARAQYEKRKRKRVHIYIDCIEPQSKRMSDADKDRFQCAVAEQLSAMKRSTFRGGIALKIDLATTSKNAPHAHTIAKNLLDILGARRPTVPWPRAHLLYKDDSQIQALSVSCRHGEASPAILIEARPFKAMIDDLALAAEAARDTEMDLDFIQQQDREYSWIEVFREHRGNEVTSRQKLGDEFYEGYLKFTRWQAQRAWLKRSGVSTPVLSWMYGSEKDNILSQGRDLWADLVGKSTYRLQVGALPIAVGSSSGFKKNVTSEITTLKERWDWLLSPLIVSVALEVVVRPDAATPPAVLHDLDNIVRDYLIPQIVPKFGTVSDQRWTIDTEELKKTNPEVAASWAQQPMPPRGTEAGVTRYEAWRLPAVDGEPGFVSVALIADVDGMGDRLYEVDRSIEKWARPDNRKYGY